MKKAEFVFKLHLENNEIITKYVKEKGISYDDAYNEISAMLNNYGIDLYIEKNEGKFQVKDVKKHLGVKLGYYKILSNKKLDPEMWVEQSILTPTEKGKEIFKEYQKLSA